MNSARFVNRLAAMLVAAIASFQASWVLGVTPREPDPTLAQLAPESCVFYLQNFGMTAPNASSTNNTERLAAEPEVQAFAKAVDQVIFQGVRKWAAEEQGDIDPATAELIFEWAKYVTTHPAMAYLARIELGPDGTPRDVEAGLVCRLDERLEEARRLILDLQSKVPSDGLKKVEIAGQQVTEIRVGQGPPIYWLTSDSHLYVTVGTDSMHQLWRRTGKNPPAWYETTVKRLPVDRRWGITYVDFPALSRIVEQAKGKDLISVWSALGLNQVTSVEITSGLDDKGCLTRGRIGCETFAGIFAGLPSRALTVADLKQVPANAHVAVVSRLDAELLLDTFLKVAGSVEPRAAQQLEMELAQVTQITGVRVREDLIKSLGDTITIYQGAGGFVLLPELVVHLGVKDSKRLEAVNTRLIALAKQGLAARSENGGTRVEISPTTLGTFTGNYLKGIPIAITWVITDDALVVATSPQTIKSHLAAASGTTESLAAQADVAKLFASGDGPLALVYSDTRAGLKNSYPTLQMLANLAAGQLSQQGITFDTSTIPSVETISQHIDPSLVSIHRGTDGIQLVARETLPQTSVSTLGTPTAVALLLPAVQAARHAARRSTSINHVKMLSLGLLNYESANRKFPAAGMAIKGKENQNVGLSWRVALLPYLEHEALYREFHLDEPWDSEHNKKLIPRMPEVYRSPFSATEPGKTNYLAVRGSRSVIQAEGEGTRIAQITDGTSLTVWVVEADDEQAQIWTKPDDFSWNEKDPAAGLGKLQHNHFIAGFVDGSVRVIAETVDKNVLKALFTRDGGEVVDPGVGF